MDKDSISIDLGDIACSGDTISELYVSDDTTIDISNQGAAQQVFTFNYPSATTGISITNGGGGSWGNITTSSGIFSIDTDREFHNEIIISDGEDRIKLLATLRQWSEWLGMPVVYTTDSSVLKSNMLESLMKDWQEHLERGDLESARRSSEQFYTLKRLIGKTNDPKDN